jgi:AAA+ ATPase superfamily predicted ATPase
MHQNPFIYNAPVRGADFFNRDEIIEKLLNTTAIEKNIGNIWLTGGRCTGKTSVLKYFQSQYEDFNQPVYLKGSEQSFRASFVYSNCQDIPSMDAFFKNIYQSLKNFFDFKYKPEGDAYNIFIQSLIYVHALGYYIVLLLDEFDACLERIIDNNPQSADMFISKLNVLTESVTVNNIEKKVFTCVFAGNQRLNELTKNIKIYGSGLICEYVDLVLFTQKQVEELAQKYLENLPVCFSKKEIDSCYHYTSGYPYLVQKFFYALYNMKSKKSELTDHDIQTIETNFQNDLNIIYQEWGGDRMPVITQNYFDQILQKNSSHKQTDTENFDVFICYNSEDRKEVEAIATQLKNLDIRVWMDIWIFRPVFPWIRKLEKNLNKISSAAVFVGESGIGPWQEMEIESLLRKFVKKGSPVIPVILGSCKKTPELQSFLDGMTIVDFRNDSQNPIKRLKWGITGQQPDFFNSILTGGTMPTARQSGKTIQISQNPFNAGSPADGDDFIGRQDAIESITDFLNTPNQINYLIYGQRRIGKTSLLKRTRDLFTQGIAVYYNLQDKARMPLSQLLFELAGKIQQGVQKKIAFTRDDFDSDNDHFFQKRFLPSIFEQLPDEHSLLVLFDEFDVMDDIDDVEDPELTRLAYHQFIPYIDQLTQYSRDQAFPLKLIFAIGRNYKDLNTNRFGQLQKFSDQFELNNFSKNECNILIKGLTDHLIPFEQEAFEQLYTYTSGHPYFTQCLAKSSFDMAQKKGLKSISANIVQNQLIPAIRSFSGSVLWIWMCYSNRQKVVIYLLAKATNSVTSANIFQIEHQANELEFFPIIDQLVEVLQTLLKSQLIRFNEKDQSYNFCIEFIRKWIVMEYQPHDIQKLMDFIDEDIKFHHNNAKYYFERKDFEKAVKHYEDIIAIDARRFDALLYAGRCNLNLENIEKAIHYFYRAYDLNPHKTQKDYIKALEIKIAHLCHKAEDVSDIIKNSNK